MPCPHSIASELPTICRRCTIEGFLLPGLFHCCGCVRQQARGLQGRSDCCSPRRDFVPVRARLGLPRQSSRSDMPAMRFIGLAALACLAICPPSSRGQQQPIEFPHDRHVAKGLECIDCHSRVDTRAEAGMPSVRKCMLCHEKVATDGPGVQILRQYAEKSGKCLGSESMSSTRAPMSSFDTLHTCEPVLNARPVMARSAE